jgi:NAD(P)H-dependent FMN reductase
MKNVVALIGSAATGSTNHKLIEFIQAESLNIFQITVFDRLKCLPHFDPDRSLKDVPAIIADLRSLLQNADGVIICTPEYIFSVPSGLKNVVEWFVATTIFSNKPVGLITASTSGLKAHEELQLIMHTLMATFTTETTMLIQGIKGKVDAQGNIINKQTRNSLLKFIESLDNLIDTSLSSRG